MPRSFKSRSIADVLFNEKEFSKIVKTANQEEVILKFHDVFPELKKIAQAVKFTKSVLFLRVENSVWRNELNLKQEAMIKKIKKHFNKVNIKKN
jgi:hypothetical protein